MGVGDSMVGDPLVGLGRGLVRHMSTLRLPPHRSASTALIGKGREQSASLHVIRESSVNCNR